MLICLFLWRVVAAIPSRVKNLVAEKQIPFVRLRTAQMLEVRNAIVQLIGGRTMRNVLLWLLRRGWRCRHFFYRILDQLADCLPNHERIVIAGSSHTVPSESPDAYDQAVLTFLTKH